MVVFNSFAYYLGSNNRNKLKWKLYRIYFSFKKINTGSSFISLENDAVLSQYKNRIDIFIFLFSAQLPLITMPADL